MMKQNMCVTVDIDVHTWLRYKGGKLSTNVNRILLDAMIAEKKEERRTYQYQCPECGYLVGVKTPQRYLHCEPCLEKDSSRTIWMEEFK
jgi:hypothetical protein